MITKVGMINQQPKANSMKNQPTAPTTQGSAAPTTPVTTPVDGGKLSSALMAMNNLNFGRQVPEFGEKELAKAVASNKITVPDIFDIENDVDLPLHKTKGTKAKDLNPAGFHIIPTSDDTKKTVEIHNDFGDKLFKGTTDNDHTYTKANFSLGKFMPQLEIESPEITVNGKTYTIKMLAGSEVKGDGFDYKAPGSYDKYTNNRWENRDITFSGKAVFTTWIGEEATRDTVKKYLNGQFMDAAEKGDYPEVAKKYGMTLVMPVGGEGSRLANITPKGKNKPAAPLVGEFPMMGASLNAAAMGGILEGHGKDDITYLSQSHTIEGENVYHTQKYKSDGGAISEGINIGAIPKDHDALILNGDITTNADPTRVYKAMKEGDPQNGIPYLENAAIVIPFYPVDAKQATGFGLIGMEKDENGNNQIKTFAEKPISVTTPPKANDPRYAGDDGDQKYNEDLENFIKAQDSLLDPDAKEKTYAANPGIYFLSPEALEVMEQMGIENPAQTGLGAHIVPKIVELCNEGKLKDKDGNVMKAYTVPLEAKGGKPADWADLGTPMSYIQKRRDMALQTQLNGVTEKNHYYGLPEKALYDAEKSADLRSGVVFQSPEARHAYENFAKKHNVQARGNIVVSEKASA